QPHLRGSRERGRSRIGDGDGVPSARPRCGKRAGQRHDSYRCVGDRPARQRSKQHGERHADHHRGRRVVSSDCGCCVAVSSEAHPENRPWLSAVAYRIGTFATFRKEIVDELSHTRELAGLTARVSDDYTITAIELWAAVAD